MIGMVEMEIRRMARPDYQTVEAINTLCTNLSFAGGDFKKIMVTSCHPQEGKSFISMNLLHSLAESGKKVALVDTDIRDSALRGTYGIKPVRLESSEYLGLSGYLAGRCGMNEIIAKTDIPGAYIVLSGRTISNSLPLINSPKFGELLDKLAEQVDIVIVDAPPVGTIIDAARVSALCDGTLFIVQSGTVTIDELKNAVAQIEKAGCPMLGYVLNKFEEKRFGNKYNNRKSY